MDAAQYCMVSQDKIISLVKLGKEVDLVVKTMIAKKIMINTMNLHEGYRERKVQEDIVKAEKVANTEKHGSKEVASLGIVVTKEEEGFHFLFCKLHKKVYHAVYTGVQNSLAPCHTKPVGGLARETTAAHRRDQPAS